MNNPRQHYPPTNLGQPQPASNRKLWIILGMIVGTSTLLTGGCVAFMALLGSAGKDDPKLAINNPTPASPTPAQATSAEGSAVTSSPATASTPAYTEKEYQLYREVMDSPPSEAESKIFERLGKKHGMPAKEVKATVERLMTTIHSGGAAANQNREQEIEEAVGKLARVKTVSVSSDFAGVAYVEQAEAADDDDVRRKVLERMPAVLEAIFSVPGIERARLIAYYPTTNGGETKVAGFEAYRSEFKAGKRPEEYRDFWVR